MPQPLWTPSADRIAATRMTAFRLFINQRHGMALADYPALHAWSVAQREAFWQAIVDFFEIRFSTPATAVLQEGPVMPSAHWFPGATLNFAEQLGVVRRNPRNFRQPSSSPATSASRSMNLPSVWKV